MTVANRRRLNHRRARIVTSRISGHDVFDHFLQVLWCPPTDVQRYDVSHPFRQVKVSVFVPGLRRCLEERGSGAIFRPRLVPNFQASGGILRTRVNPGEDNTDRVSRMKISNPSVSSRLVGQINMNQLYSERYFPSSHEDSILPVVRATYDHGVHRAIRVMRRYLQVSLVQLFRGRLLLLMVSRGRREPPFHARSIRATSNLCTIVRSRVEGHSIGPPGTSVQQSQGGNRRQQAFSLHILSVSAVHVSSSLLRDSTGDSPYKPTAGLFPRG